MVRGYAEETGKIWQGTDKEEGVGEERMQTKGLDGLLGVDGLGIPDKERQTDGTLGARSG